MDFNLLIWVLLDFELANLVLLDFNLVKWVLLHFKEAHLYLNYSVNTQDLSEKTGIIVVKRENLDSTKVVSHLFHHKVIAASRLGGIRFAPHAYNSEAQIDKVIDILSREFGE